MSPCSALLQDVWSVTHRGHVQESAISGQPFLLWPWLPVLPETFPVRRLRADPQSGTQNLNEHDLTS